MSLRVALVHSFYSSRQPSGENATVESELELLLEAGIDALLFAARTDDLEHGVLHPLRAALRVATGHGASPAKSLAMFAPDVIHVHNTFPNFGRTWATDLGVPMVTTLHNYRFTCANGVLFRDGHMCTECPDGRRWSGLRHRCYRGSLAATLPLTIANRRGPGADPLLTHADRILCLSARQRHMLQDNGVDGARIVDWVNFLPERLDPGPGTDVRDGCLCVARLTAEKGVVQLARAWSSITPLRIAGDGPELAAVRQAARGRNVEVLGLLPRSQVVDLMRQSLALVCPSDCPEVAPLVYVEALASGLPIVVRNTSDLADRVRLQGTGVTVNRLGEIPDALVALKRTPDLARHCRTVFDVRYSARTYRQRLLRLYEEVTATDVN